MIQQSINNLQSYSSPTNSDRDSGVDPASIGTVWFQYIFCASNKRDPFPLEFVSNFLKVIYLSVIDDDTAMVSTELELASLARSERSMMERQR